MLIHIKTLKKLNDVGGNREAFFSDLIFLNGVNISHILVEILSALI